MKKTEISSYNNQFAVLEVMAILYVVLGHNHVEFASIENLFSYDSFHMALFMFISGYFLYKSQGQVLTAYLIKNFKKLIIPFGIWNIIYGVVSLIMNRLLGITWCSADRFWEMILIRPFTLGNIFLISMLLVGLFWFCLK